MTMTKGIEVIFFLVCFTGPSIIHCHTANDESGCGKSMGCYTCADNIDDCKADKKYVLTYKKDGDYIEFEMSGKKQWVAVGFNSKKNSMPGTDAVMCATISGDVKLQHYDLTTKSLPQKTDPLPPQITFIDGNYTDGKTTCRFKRKIDASERSLKSLDTTHYLVFAYGPVGSKPGYHTWRATTDKEVNVQIAASIIGGSTIDAMIKAHGSLMTLAWMCFAAIAIFMARYMRLVWEDEKLLGQKVWFTVHRGLMILVIIFNTIGIVLIFVHRKGWSEGIGAHPYTGIITFGLALIQPIMAFFRPHPDEAKRYIFNWAHRTVGLSALVLGVVTLFLAVFIKFLDLEKTGLPPLIVFCVGVLIVLLFDIYFCSQQASNKQENITAEADAEKNKRYDAVEEMEELKSMPSLSSSGRCLRLALFGFVVLLALTTSLSLVIIIAMK
ncbi:ferric-chelate reductase 1-like isoform X2 [Actinia tenebrosa]|uniref:Ferric-chelate reductase 1-like isoform X2 n=1 Tax=Actinia tenebrosa TaxID=6105 RepID=A0A6P8HCZ7_ACTTE|nr:ferric-chelate reductase 1-like isoform X2 [Actinia tenebrosa]